MPRVTLVRCSSRLPAGQLTLAAWDALRRGPVVVDGPDQAHLADAGIAWTSVTAQELAASPEPELVWLTSDPGAGALLDELGVAWDEVVGAVEPPGARLLDVVAVMDRLRSPGGCPWDAQQTHTSLMPYLLEEAYETYEALENGDDAHLREELGDLLLQIVFHARVSEAFDVDDVAGDLVDKLVRRHPHVFAGAPADDLEGSWEALKAAEKGRTSVTEGVPLGQPALMLAAKLQRRAAKLGAPPVELDGPGGQLWALVEQCRAQGLDPEVELRTVARAYRDRLAAVERAGAPDTGDAWREALG
ncbi:MAG: MazG family protein [Mycobacteriales bacterium]